ncbi:MAG: hypothetical protein J6U77_06800, partial [Verrucomicrobia bacterium]|nr:hypothetical protein [Verrucomicrobiota bacterium]
MGNRMATTYFRDSPFVAQVKIHPFFFPLKCFLNFFRSFLFQLLPETKKQKIIMKQKKITKWAQGISTGIL